MGYTNDNLRGTIMGKYNSGNLRDAIMGYNNDNLRGVING